MLRAVVRSMRPSHWLKNLIIFAPLIFARELLDLEKLGAVAVATGLFCLLAGAVYIANDVADRKRDALHPRKSKRPVASGRLSPRAALGAAGVLASGVFGAVAAWYPNLAGVFLAYLALQFLYTWKFKHVPVLDAMSISAGFVVRIFVGTVAAGVVLSEWMMAVIFLLGFFLVLIKRRQELVAVGEGAHRPALQGYTTEWLDQVLGISAASVIISYLIYTLSPETVERFGTDRLFFTNVFVIFGVLKYLYHTRSGKMPDNPIELVMKDETILVSILLWGLTTVLFIYFFP